MQEQLLTPKKVEDIESALAKGDRVELIPVKDGVKVIKIKREEIRKIGKRV